MAHKFITQDIMFFTFFTAVSEATGKIYHGFRLCRKDWDDNRDVAIPSKADMVDHIYRTQTPYANGIGAVTIIEMRYHHIPLANNILLNLN